MKKIIRYFFEARFLPTVLLLLPIVFDLVLIGVFERPTELNLFLAKCSFYFFGIALLAYLVHLIVAIFKKRWVLFICEGLIFAFFGFWVFVLLSLAYSFALSGEPDSFADDLVIPADMEVCVPKDTNHAFFHLNDYATEGSFQYELAKAFKGELVSLGDLDFDAIDKETLLRYLASSSDWKLHYQNGDLIAYRRWRFKDKPSEENFIRVNPQRREENFSLYSKIYFDGKIDKNYSKQVDRPSYFQDKETIRFESKINLGYGYLSLTEENKIGEPRISHKAIELLKEEFARLAKAKDFEDIKAILPADSMKIAEPSFEIINGMQGGIYILSAWLNPMEAGHIYLKAYEVTKGTPLSELRLKKRSNEVVGYSDNEEEMFFSMMEFTIYEGDWGKYYAARIEIHFVPDSGAPERKLAEKVYKIEGWQR